MLVARRTRDVHGNLLLTIFAAAAFMTSLDVFIVNVGLSAVGRDVGQGSLNDLSWVLNAYTIVFAALLVPAGRLGDRYGNKLVLLVGLVLFAAARLGCAISSNLWLIVGLRCVQAAGGAALVPTSLGLILTTIPAERRQHAIRIWAIVGSLGAAAGPAIGGLLVALSWRWIFVINVPIGLTAALAAALLVPDARHNRETHIPDLLGGGLLVVAVGSIALALVQGPDWGWGSASTIIAVTVTLVSTGLFLARSARAAAPVIDLALFKDRTFARANGAMFFANLAFGLQLLGLILWMQDGWGWSALQTGLAIAPGPAMVSITALGLRPRLPKLSESITAAIGVLLMGGGGLLIGVSIGAHANYAADVLPGWMIIGAGVGLSLPITPRRAPPTSHRTKPPPAAQCCRWAAGSAPPSASPCWSSYSAPRPASAPRSRTSPTRGGGLRCPPSSERSWPSGSRVPQVPVCQPGRRPPTDLEPSSSAKEAAPSPASGSPAFDIGGSGS
jgi:MFS family permease